MTNLTSSVCLLGKNADIGAIKLSLPADIIPPEVNFFFERGVEEVLILRQTPDNDFTFLLHVEKYIDW